MHDRNIRSSNIVIVLAFLFIGSCTAHIQAIAVEINEPVSDQSELRRWFLSESKKAWSKLANKTKSISCRYEYESGYLKHPEKKNELQTTSEYQFFSLDDCVVEIFFPTNKPEEETVEHVMAKNNAYAFSLSRHVSQGRVSLESIEKAGKSKQNDVKIKQQVKNARAFPYHFMNFRGTSLQEWLERPGFEVLHVSKIPSGDKNYVKVDFNYEPALKVSSDPSLKDGFILLDPEKYWSIVEYKIGNVGNKTSASCQIDYAIDSTNLPVLDRIESVLSSHNGDYIYRQNVVFHEFNIAPSVEEEIFYLSHYGLPEPNFEESFFSGWIKYFLAGLFCLGIAYWLKRRRAGL